MKEREPLRYECFFDGDADDALRARLFAERALVELSAHPCDDAILVVAELAANAVVHGRTAFTVSIERTGDSLRIAVSDGSPEPPRRVEPSALAAYGRGISIVERVSTAWGWDPTPGNGKTVWAQVPVVHEDDD